jgi:RNA polymerase sigma factor (TIGR02999 family)
MVDPRAQPANASTAPAGGGLPAMLEEMRKIAAAYLRRERKGHTLQATALVHEAYMRLASDSRFDWSDRAQVLGIAAASMRQVLVDHARRRSSLKRGGGGGRLRVTLSDRPAAESDGGIDMLALDEALKALSALDARKSRVVEMRLLGGLSEPDIAQALGVSERTVRNDWSFARAWLEARLAGS